MRYFGAFIDNFAKRVGTTRVFASLKFYKYSYKCLAAFLESAYMAFHIVRLRMIVAEAITYESRPAFFVGYEAQNPKCKQKYLTSDELKRLMTALLHDSRLYHEL